MYNNGGYMVTGHVFIATSLDGYIARNDGDIGWLMALSNTNESHGYDEFMEKVDGIVMGRGTYEKVLTFPSWPFQKPVVVLSQTLAKESMPTDLVGRVRFSSKSPSKEMLHLSNEGWRRAYIDGGKLIQSFLREDLIEDLVITQVPILLGSGRPLFGSLEKDVGLLHVATRVFPSGFVQSHYRVKK